MKQAAVPPTLQPSSRADLERKRNGVVAQGPSGAVYRIRKLNLARQAAAGGMTTKLRDAAIEAMTKTGEKGDVGAFVRELGPDVVKEALDEERAYQDRLVLATVIEPELTEEDLGGDDLTDDPVLPAVDYEWLLAVARGRERRDGQGRWLWGPPPLDLWDVWRDAHECDQECKGCIEAVEVLTAPVAEA